MRKLMKLALIGLTLIFTMVACSPSGIQTPEPGQEAPTIPTEPKGDVVIPISPTDTKNSSDSQTERTYEELEIVTLLPRDAIPAIDDPEFLSVDEADTEYASNELVIGVNYEGDARAYSIPYLSGHEIVNDTVGGREIAVTW